MTPDVSFAVSMTSLESLANFFCGGFLLVSSEDRSLLGVHVFGTGATELIHIGQAVMGCGGTVDYLVDAVFNYPTLAESYKVAALDAMNKIRQIAWLSE